MHTCTVIVVSVCPGVKITVSEVVTNTLLSSGRMVHITLTVPCTPPERSILVEGVRGGRRERRRDGRVRGEG